MGLNWFVEKKPLQLDFKNSFIKVVVLKGVSVMLSTLESIVRTHVSDRAKVSSTHTSVLVDVEHPPSFQMSITPTLDGTTGEVSFVLRGKGPEIRFDNALGVAQQCDVHCVNHMAKSWSRVG
jgi:hypothetical protein